MDQLPLPKPHRRTETARRRKETKEARSEAVEAAIDLDGRCMAFGCLCRADKRYIATKLDGHHIIPRSQGGPDTPDNIISLCHGHAHKAAHGGYRDGSRRVSAAEFMWETLSRYRDTNEWRWSEEAWQFVQRRYERVKDIGHTCPECRRQGIRSEMQNNGPGCPPTCVKCGRGND